MLTFWSRYYVRAGEMVLLASPQLSKLTLAESSVEVPDLLQPLRKPMFTSQPSTPQSPPLMISSGSSGRSKNHLLTKLPYLLRNVQLFITLSLTMHSHSMEGRTLHSPSAERSIGESRSQAVKRFLSLERSLNQKGFLRSSASVYYTGRKLKNTKRGSEARKNRQLHTPPPPSAIKNYIIIRSW